MTERMNLTAEEAAGFGVERDIEAWLFELKVGIRDPIRYSDALTDPAVGPESLINSLGRMDAVIQMSELGEGLLVPHKDERQFIEYVRDLRARVWAEGVRRGLNLTGWAESGGRAN